MGEDHDCGIKLRNAEQPNDFKLHAIMIKASSVAQSFASCAQDPGIKIDFDPFARMNVIQDTRATMHRVAPPFPAEMARSFPRL